MAGDHGDGSAPDAPALRKARGAFFTPPELCRLLVDWAVRAPSDRVLEPSAGEAAFLTAAVGRLRDLGAATPGLTGVELHEPSARAAATAVRAAGGEVDMRVADFFTVAPRPEFDAVVGNPPFVRYQDFAGDARLRARAAALRGGVALTNLASSWAAFTVHAALFLRPGGRLALVLPAELLSTNYAEPVRAFLLRRFGRVRLVLFTERIFPGVLEEVVLLLAEGEGGADHAELRQVRDLAGLADLTDLTERPDPAGPAPVWSTTPTTGKWVPALLSAAAADLTTAIAADPRSARLQDWGETTLGAVTGANSFFTLTRDRIGELGLRTTEVVRLSPPGSRHLRGLAFTPTGWQDLVDAGGRAWLFRPPGEPSPGARRLIAQGEADGVHEAFKCRIRRPWWRVPVPPVPDLLVTYMNADTPRLTTNRARVHHLNSVHGLYLRPHVRALGRDLLPVASLSSVTVLGAELVGRSYGGGMLKLEPGEADQLPVPAPAVVEAAGPALRAVIPRVRRLLAAGHLTGATALVDGVLLRGELGLSAAEVAVLGDAALALRARRTARGRSRP